MIQGLWGQGRRGGQESPQAVFVGDEDRPYPWKPSVSEAGASRPPGSTLLLCQTDSH